MESESTKSFTDETRYKRSNQKKTNAKKCKDYRERKKQEFGIKIRTKITNAQKCKRYRERKKKVKLLQETNNTEPARSERICNSQMEICEQPEDVIQNTSFHNFYQQLNNCAQPRAIYYHGTDIPSDGNCFFSSMIKSMNLSTTPIDIRRQLLASPLVDSCVNPNQARSILSSETEYAEMDCIGIFSKVYNQNICIHNHFVNAISNKEEQQFLHFRVNSSKSFVHLHLQDVHFTPLIEVFDRKKTRKSRAEYMKKYRLKRKEQNDLEKLNMCINSHSDQQKNQSKSEHFDSQIQCQSTNANRKRRMQLYSIDDDARQVIYNVYLYFMNEAERFQKTEDGYFQKVQERVSTACCVSRGFLINMLNENEFDEGSSKNEMWKKKRRLQAKELQNSICDLKDKQKTPEDAKKPKKIVGGSGVLLPEPPPLIRKPEIKAIREPGITERDLPPLTPISKPEMPTNLKPFVIKSTSPPPLTPIITKTFSLNLQLPIKSEFSPVVVKTEDMNPGSSYATSGTSPTLEFETRDNNVWIKHEPDLSDYDESILSYD